VKKERGKGMRDILLKKRVQGEKKRERGNRRRDILLKKRVQGERGKWG
jgi:hypothetical protein